METGISGKKPKIMKKIVITGGLGYVGTELCRLYSGETRFNNIVVVDSRFVSERVKQLIDWGFTFIQGSILDADLMNKVINDADIVHHLAGITDVAYVKTESNSAKDKEITEVAVTGTLNILNAMPFRCKIIFPSTHVVYEGFDKAKFVITEDVPPTPVLTYAKGKVQNEIDIKGSDKDYVILRLGSVYGYSTDTMRLSIMPNLFSKMAALGQTIKLFAGGKQYKSLVNIIDVARCLKFMADNNIKNETFHLTHDTMTVKEVAEICRKFKPNAKIVETNDEIPNLGYTLSNVKLLNTGFRFLYNIKDSIGEMIRNWSARPANPELEYIIYGGKEYRDSRGVISNYELVEPVNLIGHITSKAGSVRANHFHPIQTQECLLVKGKYISVIKDLSQEGTQITTKVIKAGEIAVIQPNVAHAMVFLEDSIFLNLVRGEREHSNYGITHTIPYILVDENYKKQLISEYLASERKA
jgi:nucleoside-diphosphate-sugar epimerase/dTDP-4-dehydrorhamnose 3,5-epimerase-like enzyme